MALNINGTTGISGIDGSATTPAFKGTDSNTGINFGTDIVQISTGGATRATVNANGKLGLGIVTPTRPLHIASDEDLTSFTGTTKGALCLSNSDYASGDYSAIDFTYTGSDNPLVRIGAKITGAGSTLSFGTSNNFSNGITNEAVQIDSNGKMIIGSPTVNTTIASSLVTAGRIQTDGTASITTSSSANVFISSSTGLLSRSTSSSRYKKDIADATWGLADVLKLKPKTFKSNATGEDADNNTYGGFIAEDVHDIGLTNFVEYNDSDQPDAIHYGNMVALLTKAIQELNTKVEVLETKVAALEAG